MSKHSVHAEAYATNIPLWDKLKAEKVETEVHFLIPYEEFDQLYGDVADADNLVSLRIGSGIQSTMDKWKEACNVGPTEPVVAVGIWGGGHRTF